MSPLVSPRQQLVNIMNRLYYGGLTTLSGGNLSIRDEDGGIWITPSAVDKGKLTPADIMYVAPDGQAHGLHKPSSELPFHRAIYQRRPDLRAIVHAHAPALVSFSIARRIPDTSLIPQARRVCGRVGYAPYALPGSEMLGDSIANSFAQGYDSVLLENHGAVTAGQTVLEAFQRLETLDFCARTQMYARSLGAPITNLSDAQLALFDNADNLLPEFTPTQHSSQALELRESITDLVRRACQRQLMISTEGVVSARIDADSFLITPTNIDRPSITPDDIVLIRNGQREAGKLPSRSVRLHEAIYNAHPRIGCVMTSQAPNITAFAISQRQMDTKTIPESYIMLMDIPKLPYEILYTHREAVAAAVSPQTPVILLQNDCVLTTGTHPLQAFDRLEVAEFTARSLIESERIGEVSSIGPEAIADLRRAFANIMQQ
jgi:L-fuculose-phosphate aldolase